MANAYDCFSASRKAYNVISSKVTRFFLEREFISAVRSLALGRIS